MLTGHSPLGPSPERLCPQRDASLPQHGNTSLVSSQQVSYVAKDGIAALQLTTVMCSITNHLPLPAVLQRSGKASPPFPPLRHEKLPADGEYGTAANYQNICVEMSWMGLRSTFVSTSPTHCTGGQTSKGQFQTLPHHSRKLPCQN